MKDPFEHEQEEPLREVMTVPLLEQLHREARGFALTAALAVGLVRRHYSASANRRLLRHT